MTAFCAPASRMMPSAAVFWPAGFVYPAGLALVLANGWLMRNLWSGVSVYRAHLQKIAANTVRAGT